MEIELIEENGKRIPVISGGGVILSDVSTAVDLIGRLSWEYCADRAAINKKNIAEEFFTLRNRLAGEILQKFSTYRIKIAIYGDFSGYTSEALQAFIRESNRGGDVFFPLTKEEAVRILAESES